MRAESGGAGQGRSVDRPLIASYSYSGHTHRAAQALQGLTGSDWCEIYPRQPYPMAFPELLAQVKRELKTGYRPKLLPLSHPPPRHSVIFLGPPHWWGALPPPVSPWLRPLGLSGKQILPFYSHCGGVPCDMRRDIQKLCPKAEVGEALGILDAEEDTLPELLSRWLARMGLAVALKF